MNKIFGCSCGGLLGFRVVKELDLTDAWLTEVGADCTGLSAVARVGINKNNSVTIIRCRSVELRGISIFVL